MRAAVIYRQGGAEVLEVAEIDAPELKPDEVKVKVAYASVNPIDWKVRNGDLNLVVRPKLPCVLGCDFSGEVVALGADVKTYKIGDRVYGAVSPYTTRWGAYAEYVNAPSSAISRVPDEISLEDAAAVPVAALSSIQCIRRMGRLKSGDHVLIIGASGGLGAFAVQIAHLMGVKVTAVCSEKNIELVRSLGADFVIDYQKEDYLRQAQIYDAVLDLVNACTFFKCRRILKRGGAYAATSPSASLFFAIALTPFKFLRHARLLVLRPRDEELQWLETHLASHTLRVVIGARYALTEIQAAHRLSESGRAVGKIVVDCAK